MSKPPIEAKAPPPTKAERVVAEMTALSQKMLEIAIDIEGVVNGFIVPHEASLQANQTSMESTEQGIENTSICQEQSLRPKDNISVVSQATVKYAGAVPETSLESQETADANELSEEEITALEAENAADVQKWLQDSAAIPKTSVEPPAGMKKMLDDMKSLFGQWQVLESDLKIEVSKMSRHYRDLLGRHQNVRAEDKEIAKLAADLLDVLDEASLREVYDGLAKRKDLSLLERFQEMECFERILGYGNGQDDEG